MLIATIWRSLRWRLLAVLLLVALPAFLVAWSYASVKKEAAFTSSYMGYLDAAWFHLPGPSALLLIVAVIVSASGRLMRPGGEMAYTLALPISRRRWLLAHAGAFVATVAVVQLSIDVVLVLGAQRASQPIDVGTVVLRSIAPIAASAAWVGVTIGALGLVRYPVLAVILVLGALNRFPGTGRFQMDLPPKPSMQVLSAWDPWAFADPRAWQHGRIPVESLLVAAVLGFGGLMVGLWRLERLEP